MSTNSKIEWTEATWNPVTGCAAVSEGCRNCWAAAMTRRFETSNLRYSGLINAAGHFNGTVKLHDDLLNVPLGRRKPTTYFVCSMSDLFGEGVPFEFIYPVFAVMALCPQHTFQVLTKRPERMAESLVNPDCGALVRMALEEFESLPEATTRLGDLVFDMDHPLTDCSFCCVFVPTDNVWLGTSCEDQTTFDARVPHLLRCPAAVRFVSAEPLLGLIDMDHACVCHCGDHRLYCPTCDRRQLDWVIVGGESGPGARPMKLEWARSIRDQCRSAGVPFFFKQWGEYDENGRRVGKKAAGRRLDGRTWDEMPKVNHATNPEGV